MTTRAATQNPAAGIDRALRATVAALPQRAVPNATTPTATSTMRTGVAVSACRPHITHTSASATPGACRLRPTAAVVPATTRKSGRIVLSLSTVVVANSTRPARPTIAATTTSGTYRRQSEVIRRPPGAVCWWAARRSAS